MSCHVLHGIVFTGLLLLLLLINLQQLHSVQVQGRRAHRKPHTGGIRPRETEEIEPPILQRLLTHTPYTNKDINNYCLL